MRRLSLPFRSPDWNGRDTRRPARGASPRPDRIRSPRHTSSRADRPCLTYALDGSMSSSTGGFAGSGLGAGQQGSFIGRAPSKLLARWIDEVIVFARDHFAVLPGLRGGQGTATIVADGVVAGVPDETSYPTILAGGIEPAHATV